MSAIRHPLSEAGFFYKQVIGDIYNIRCLCHLSPMFDSPVRVLHIANSLGLGGTEKVMQLFVASLDKTRFLPAVYSPKSGERDRKSVV